MSREGKIEEMFLCIKTEAPSRIFLMISMSKAVAISLKAKGTMADFNKMKSDKAFDLNIVDVCS